MTINNFSVADQGRWTIECADVEWAKSKKRVYFAVPLQYKNAICTTNADAFVIGFCQVAAKYNEDIIVEGRPVSRELAEKMESMLFPAFNKMGCGDMPIHICATLSNESFGKRDGATGISLGVDSFYSIFTNTPDGIKYVVSVSYVDNFSALDSNPMSYDSKYEKKSEVAALMGLELIPILTNIVSLLNQEYSFVQTHTFAHLFTSMALMNWIDEYHYATGYSNKDYYLCFVGCSHYDVLTSQVLDYHSFKMHTSGGDVTRVKKTEYLSEKAIAKAYLDVCLLGENQKSSSFVNCSKCAKCRRTITTLDVLGKLSEFDRVFDVNYYNTHKSWYWGELYYAAYIMKDLLAKEILETKSETGFNVPLAAWWFFIRRGILNQIRKIRRLKRKK